MTGRLNSLLVVPALLCAFVTCHAQNEEWTWTGGATPSVPAGNYGTQGVPAIGNHPGARQGAMSWTDRAGNLWLFGGMGNDSSLSNTGYLNDLWQFSPSSGEWTWIGGSDVLPSCSAGSACGGSGVYGVMGTPSAENMPGGRTSAVAWTDRKGNLWLFGGYGLDSSGQAGELNDLWEFNPATAQWAWMGGGKVLPSCGTANECGAAGVYGTLHTASPANVPGGRSAGVGWVDSQDNFWLFGGSGYDSVGNSGNLNDLWEFDPTNGQWIWMGGSSTVPASCSPYTSCGPPGIYGTAGTPSASNIPGGRYGAVAWTDSHGNFWLFGGEANYTYADGSHGDMNDLWKFSPSSHEWTWTGGNESPLNSCNGLKPCRPLPVYGLWQTPAAANIPGAREDAVAWVDSGGKAWLFGGYGLDSAGSLGYLNDLWEFDPETNQWAWVSGTTLQGQDGSEGIQGIASFQTAPGGRGDAAGWTDGRGNLWLMGGFGYSQQEGLVPLLGDLWTFQVYDSAPSAATPTFSPAGGSYTSPQSVVLSDSTPGTIIYYMIDANAPAVQYTGPIAVTSSQTIQAVASAEGYANSSPASADYTLSLPTPAAPTFSPEPGTYYGPQSVSISDAASYATIYYTTDKTTPTINSQVYKDSVQVNSTETIQAIAFVSGGGSSAVAGGTYTILPTPPNTWTWVGGSNSLDRRGSYGVLGQPLAQNIPGGRADGASWTDTKGNFWLFGGKGTDSQGNNGWLNDVWEYTPSSTTPQDNQWTWEGGNNIANQAGVYGTLNTPAISNIPGGRTGAAVWTDANGNFWLFGGYGYDSIGRDLSFLNDLWEFNPGTRQWTWVSGSSSAEYLVSVEGYGQPGVYGTVGTPSSANVPGSREWAASWIDGSGNLWLFGGQGLDAAGQEGQLNDLWVFSPSDRQWTWMGGSAVMRGCDDVPGNCGEPGSYGTLGTGASGNIPGGRSKAASWSDSSGNFWLFGGDGYDANGTRSSLNDVWKFNPGTGDWTWISGTSVIPCVAAPALAGNICAQPATYGTLGVLSAGNSPGGRYGAAHWIDSDGNLWLFGGSGLRLTTQVAALENAAGILYVTGTFNDVWVFNPSSGKWAWMAGDSQLSNCVVNLHLPINLVVCDGSQGSYGSQYLPEVGNAPETRDFASGWADTSGNFWLFGGEFTNLTIGLDGWVNDFWEYQFSINSLPPAATPLFSLEPGTYGMAGPLTIANGMANASIYYTIDGSVPSTSSTLYTGPITVSSSDTVRAMAAVPGYIPSGTGSATYNIVTSVATPTFSDPAGTYTTPQVVTIADATLGTSIYYSTDGSDPMAGSLYSGPLTITGTETLKSVALIAAMHNQNGVAVVGIPNEVVGPVASATYTINLPQAAAPVFSIPAGTYDSAETVSINDSTSGATIYYTTDGSTPTSSSATYTNAISVSSTERLQAIAVAAGYTTSNVTAAAYTIPLPSPAFTLSDNPSSLTISAGSPGTLTLTVTPENGFNSAVTFSCSDLPAGVSCTFSPTTVTPNGSAASTQLTLSTSLTSASAERSGSSLLPALALAGCLLLFKRRLKLGSWCALALLGITLFALIACGGGGNTGGTGGNHPVTSTVMVTGASGSEQQTTSISLTVN